MGSVKMKRFILYRQRSVLCNVADIKHFGEGGTWKSVSHKSCSPLYIVIYILTQKEALRLSCWMGPAGVERAHLVLVVGNLLRN